MKNLFIVKANFDIDSSRNIVIPKHRHPKLSACLRVSVLMPWLVIF
jgi:hypothetical protein